MNGTLFDEPRAAGTSAKMPLDAVLDFLFAGNATFTVKSQLTGARHTYRVRAADRPGLFFVSSPQGSGFNYLGLIRDGQFSVTQRSMFRSNDEAVVAFRWLYTGLVLHRPLRGVEVWHEGRCGMCGRALTVPESIASGFGPDCAARRLGR